MDFLWIFFMQYNDETWNLKMKIGDQITLSTAYTHMVGCK